MTGERDRHLTDDEMVLLYYGEVEAGAEARAHLEACAACRESQAVLERVLAAVDEGSTVPERGPDYARTVMERLRTRLEPARTAPSLGRLRPLLALAATVALAFALGRLTSPPQVVEVPTPGPVRERVLLVAVGDHLERSRMVLVELTHAVGDPEVDLTREREWAQDLVSDNRLYRQTAEHAGERGVANVLDELERVLLELSNGPETMSRAELVELVERIRSRDVLFKVTVLGNQVRERQQALIRATSQS